MPPLLKTCASVGLRPQHRKKSPTLNPSTRPSRPSQKSNRSNTSRTSTYTIISPMQSSLHTSFSGAGWKAAKKINLKNEIVFIKMTKIFRSKYHPYRKSMAMRHRLCDRPGYGHNAMASERKNSTRPTYGIFTNTIAWMTDTRATRLVQCKTEFMTSICIPVIYRIIHNLSTFIFNPNLSLAYNEQVTSLYYTRTRIKPKW